MTGAPIRYALVRHQNVCFGSTMHVVVMRVPAGKPGAVVTASAVWCSDPMAHAARFDRFKRVRAVDMAGIARWLRLSAIEVHDTWPPAKPELIAAPEPGRKWTKQRPRDGGARVLAALAARPMQAVQLAQLLAVSRQAVHVSLAKLQRAGAVEACDGRWRLVHAASMGLPINSAAERVAEGEAA